MKSTVFWLAAAAVVLSVAGTAAAHDVTIDRGAMNQRFEEMGHMMDRAPQMHGPARREMLHDHMRLMHEQMDAMHGMRMGHGGPGGPMMGQDRAQSAQPGGDMPRRMGAMEERMDAMQRMMEQMLHQQELMLEDDAG